MGRTSIKPRNGGQWTEARYFSFIKGALRAASARWGPRFECIKRAKVGYGQYKCDCCGVVGPPTLPPKERGKRRINNAVADHIDPVIDPEKGFENWDTLINRLFVELDGWQCLCHKCDTQKQNEERELRKESKSNRALHPREESSYRNMCSRCTNPKATGYQYYGGKGVKVCDRWLASFDNFLEDMGPRPEGTSLDRKDYDGDYTPENCRWATDKEQARNTSFNHYISIKGVAKTISEWGEERNILPNTILYRIRRGWLDEEALEFTERKEPHRSRLSVDEWSEIQALRDEGYTTTSLGKMFGIDASQVSRKTKPKGDKDIGTE